MHAAAIRRSAAGAAMAVCAFAFSYGTAAPAAAATKCAFPASPDRVVWTGNAGDGRWSTAANWNPSRVPGASAHLPTDDVVCIAAPAVVTIGQGEAARLRAVDIQGKVIVGDAVNGGGTLVLDGGASNTPSTIRDIDVLASTLGGRATVTITGTIVLRALPPYAAHMTTREVQFRPPIGSDPFVNPGITIIAAGATMSVDGTDPACPQVFCGGLGLEDQRFVENHGLVLLSNQGFIAADDGTTFRNASDGELRLANDAGYYQGFILDLLDRPVFANGGLVRKSAGTGTSIIDADYQPTDGSTTGSVQVDTGALSIFADDGTATVRPAGTFGTGACGTEQSVCTAPVATSSDVEATAVTLSSRNRGAASVAIAEQGVDPLIYPDYLPKGRQVEIVLGQSGVAANRPAIIALIMDGSIFAAGTKVSEVRVGSEGSILPSCRTGTLPCVVSVKAGTGDDIVATVQTGQVLSRITPLGPGFRG